ncbi:hypothetical protein HK096_006757 [Nowakowskiella sp. JEL0078]|nr:hypothetical protein HK096_006757 [Nowakowskiella sp. JEL0078]
MISRPNSGQTIEKDLMEPQKVSKLKVFSRPSSGIFKKESIETSVNNESLEESSENSENVENKLSSEESKKNSRSGSAKSETSIVPLKNLDKENSTEREGKDFIENSEINKSTSKINSNSDKNTGKDEKDFPENSEINKSTSKINFNREKSTGQDGKDFPEYTEISNFTSKENLKFTIDQEPKLDSSRFSDAEEEIVQKHGVLNETPPVPFYHVDEISKHSEFDSKSFNDDMEIPIKNSKLSPTPNRNKSKAFSTTQSENELVVSMNQNSKLQLVESHPNDEVVGRVDPKIMAYEIQSNEGSENKDAESLNKKKSFNTDEKMELFSKPLKLQRKQFNITNTINTSTPSPTSSVNQTININSTSLNASASNSSKISSDTVTSPSSYQTSNSCKLQTLHQGIVTISIPASGLYVISGTILNITWWFADNVAKIPVSVSIYFSQVFPGVAITTWYRIAQDYEVRTSVFGWDQSSGSTIPLNYSEITANGTLKSKSQWASSDNIKLSQFFLWKVPAAVADGKYVIRIVPDGISDPTVILVKDKMNLTYTQKTSQNIPSRLIVKKDMGSTLCNWTSQIELAAGSTTSAVFYLLSNQQLPVFADPLPPFTSGWIKSRWHSSFLNIFVNI